MFLGDSPWVDYTFNDIYYLGLALSVKYDVDYDTLDGYFWVIQKIVFKNGYYYGLDEATQRKYAIDLCAIRIFGTSSSSWTFHSGTESGNFGYATDNRILATSEVDEWCFNNPGCYLRMSSVPSRRPNLSLMDYKLCHEQPVRFQDETGLCLFAPFCNGLPGIHDSVCHN